MEGIDRALALDVEQALGAISPPGVSASRNAGWLVSTLCELVAGEVVADGVGQDEVAVGKPLHQRAGAQAVGAVVGEVGFAERRYRPGMVLIRL